MGPKRNARSISRRLSPQSPKTAPPAQTRRTRGATYDAIQVTDLQAVTEDDEDPDDSESAAQDEIQESPPSQAASDSSSESQGEMEALSDDMMIESLLDLKADAIKVLDNFKIADLLEDRIRSIRDASGPSGKLFVIQWERLFVTRRAFGERIWALPHVLVRKFQSGEPWTNIRDGAWRPDAIFYLSNLAQFVALVCRDIRTTDLLKDTFACFPAQFSGTDSADRFTTNSIPMLLQFGDELRTQWFMQEARNQITHAHFDPDELLTQVFFDDGYANRILPLAQQLGADYDSTHQDRIKQIRSAFSKSSKNPIHLDKLDKMFPWDSFVFFTVRWAVQRREELEAMINIQTGGAEGIVEAIRAGHFNLDPVLVPASGDLHAPPSLRKTAKSTGRGGRGGRGGRAPNLNRNIAALKKRQAELAAQQNLPLNPNLFENQETAAAAAALKPLIDATQQMDNGYAPLQDDDDNIPPSAQGQLSPTSSARQARDVMDVMARQAQQANKENLGGRQPVRSYMDPQPGAERITWDLESHSGAPGPSSNNKRRQPSHDSDSDDMEFEADSRQPKRPRPTSKGKGRATTHDPPSSHDHQYLYPSTQPSYPSTRSPLREQSRPPPSSAPITFPPPSSQLPIGTPYTSINQLAKQNVTATRERDNRHIVQQRRPWTEEEVHRLMDLIAMNQGPKYAKILKDDNDASIFPDGPRLVGRNQVNLKDKARNVKMDYLKARQRLPDGFANVSVGKRLVEILRGMGIDYVEGEWLVAGTQDEE